MAVNYGSYVQGVNFFGALLAGNDYGINVPSGASGALGGLFVSGTGMSCQVACINIQSQVNDVFIGAGTNLQPNSGYTPNMIVSPLSQQLTVSDTTIICNNAGIGIDFGGTGGAGGPISNQIHDNQLRGCSTAGIKLESSAAYFDVHHNDLVSQAVPLLNGMSSANYPNSYIRDNFGYNPSGYGTISIGASPATVGPFPYPTTISVNGTVSQVTLNVVGVGNIGVCNSITNCTVYVPPHETLTVTYSDLPIISAIYQ